MERANLHLFVPVPCHEQWDAMLPSQKGRMCEACNKVVLDFTTMSDDELLAYFQNYTGSACGRFTTKQLHQEKEIIMNRNMRLFLFALLLVFFQCNPADLFGQDTTLPQDTSQIMRLDSFDVSGKVFDSKKEPLDFASVVLKDRDSVIAKVFTDLKGNYKLKHVPNGKYTLVVTYLGMPTFTCDIEVKHGDQPINIHMEEPKECTGIIIGMVTSNKLVDPNNPNSKKLDWEQINGRTRKY